MLLYSSFSHRPLGMSTIFGDFIPVTLRVIVLITDHGFESTLSI